MTVKEDLLSELEERKKTLKNEIDGLKKDKLHSIKLKKEFDKDTKSLEEQKKELASKVDEIKLNITELENEFVKLQEVRDMMEHQITDKQTSSKEKINEDIRKDLAVWNKLHKGTDVLIAEVDGAEYEVEFADGKSTIYNGKDFINAKVLQVDIDITTCWEVGDSIDIDGKTGKIVKIDNIKEDD